MNNFLSLLTGGAALAASATPGTSVMARGGNMGELIQSQLHAKYYEGSYKGVRFGGGMQAVIATALSTAGATTYTGGLVLANPNGSNVNAILERVGVGFIIAQTNAAVIGIGVGMSTTALSGTLTSVAPRAKKIGSGYNPVCGLYSSASITLPIAPTLDTILMAVDTGALTVGAGGAGGMFDLDGGIVLPPGAFAMLWSSAAGTASSMMASMQWEEVPV
jgi:hypothetical protein